MGQKAGNKRQGIKPEPRMASRFQTDCGPGRDHRADVGPHHRAQSQNGGSQVRRPHPSGHGGGVGDVSKIRNRTKNLTLISGSAGFTGVLKTGVVGLFYLRQRIGGPYGPAGLAGRPLRNPTVLNEVVPHSPSSAACAMSALPQERTCAVHSLMSALGQ